MSQFLVRRCFLALAGAVLLAGCGGGASQSRFVGRWDGTARFETFDRTEDQGRLRIEVSESGSFVGTYERFSDDEIVDVTGTLYGGGSFRMRWRFSGYGSEREAAGQVRRDRNQIRPNTSDGLLPTENSSGPVGEGLGFTLDYVGD